MAKLDELRAKLGQTPEFCQSELWPLVDRFESENKVDRGEIKEKFKQGGLPLIGCFVFGYLNFKWAPILSLACAAAAGLIILPALTRFGVAATRRMKAWQALRAEIKKRALNFLDPQIMFTPALTFPQELYSGCGLFPKSYDLARAEDHCAGRVGETLYELVELAVHNVKKSTDSKGRTTTTYIPIFCGILLKADFNKNFEGHTTIRTDKAEGSFGFLARGAQRLMSSINTMNLVEMESPEFEEKFKVHSTDPVQARYILTPDFMERILALGMGCPEVQIAFRDSAVIFALPRKSAFLEMNGGTENLTSSVEGLLNDLVTLLQIIEDMKLNERIWNKQARGA